MITRTVKEDQLKLIARIVLMHSKNQISDKRLEELLLKINPSF